MADFAAALEDYALTLLLSAAVAAVATVIVRLSRTPRTVHRHVCRLGRKPARIDVMRARGPVTVSICRMDEHHVVISVDGSSEATITDDTSGDQQPRSLA
jgi:hypothetical protein